jgi:hypothetical protein
VKQIAVEFGDDKSFITIIQKIKVIISFHFTIHIDPFIAIYKPVGIGFADPVIAGKSISVIRHAEFPPDEINRIG